tara:strand:+ start:888 stop:1508 length:621 start_codon:yes stop_codon:yes gene_type:complete
MGFLFFGKKRRSEIKKAVSHIDQISDNLKESFTRIKTDIKVVRDWLSFFKTKDDEYEKRFKNIESRVDELGEVIAYLAEKDQTRPVKEAPYYGDTREMYPTISERTPLDDLTETQNAIFFRLGTLQLESGHKWVPIKNLAHDLYPEKPYDKVRSTVSEYVSILADSGLVKKIRKGKQTYVSITQKGENFFKKAKKRPTKKPVAKAK